MLLFKDSREIDRHQGVMAPEELKDFVEKAL